MGVVVSPPDGVAMTFGTGGRISSLIFLSHEKNPKRMNRMKMERNRP
jgi:hypothetical protein